MLTAIRMVIREFEREGFAIVPFCSQTAGWVESLRPMITRSLSEPRRGTQWRHGETWHLGINQLDNDPFGAVAQAGVPALTGHPWAALQALFPDAALALDRAQLSTVLPGYPRFDGTESEAAWRYRVIRDAAHVDGLLKDQGGRRLLELHDIILGLPLDDAAVERSPTVVWRGSHHMMRDAFRRALAELNPERWSQYDLETIYRETRSRVFEGCERVPIIAEKGCAWLIHPLALHGIAAWQGMVRDAPARTVVYFRPNLCPERDFARWLD
ncbi:hypothetical protein OAS86_04570 [Gammaproteobacteria bacterium]|nr:hypothetical protein [Gammaproteobacteria bacterium]